MSCGCGQTSTVTGICPCDTFIHPQIITNPPGQTHISYSIGNYLTFRHALLQSLPGEVELVNWHAGAQGDLAVQMIEWWAYIADILTFYNERIANQDYLQTADLPESVRNLILILGYRPRPGIGAAATLGALMSSAKTFTLPAGYAVQSKPGPGEQPQIFELGASTTVQQPDTIAAIATPNPSLLGSDRASVLVQGTVTAKTGDQLLLMERNWAGTDSNWAAVTVQTAAPEKDPSGNANTRITFTAAPEALNSTQATNFRLLRSSQTARVWQYPAQTVIQGTQIDLASVVRTIQPRDPVLVSLPGASPALQLVSISALGEDVWYANPAGPPYNPNNPPPQSSPAVIPIPIPHTFLQFKPSLTGFTDSPALRQATVLSFAWQDVGTIIPTPATSLSGTQVTLATPLPASLLPMSNRPLLLQGGDGNGIEADGTVNSAAPATLGLSNPTDPNATVVTPIQVLFNLLQVSRGKTVSNEILGSGDATVNVGQEFTLKKSPLTYLINPNGTSGTGYQSTLQVWVDGVQWQEVSSFYNQPANAKVFVTREDDRNITHVQFGDGVNGSRVPSGVNNIVATYRYGSGAAEPDPGSLTVILQPWPGLKSLLNPVAASGGADPDSPQNITTLGPQSVLTFGRAISANDYAIIAAQAPGVARARSYFSWDPNQGRMLVKVYVGDDTTAVTNANAALADACDPNRPLTVLPATSIDMSLSFTLLIDPSYQTASVVTAVTSTLTDPDKGLFGVNVVQIGQVFFRSQIEKACLSIPGAVAVHNLSFQTARLFLPRISIPWITRFGDPLIRFRRPGQSLSTSEPAVRFDPGEGAFYQLDSSNVTINPEVASNAG
jgi:Baseplate J-like protein